MRKKQTAFTTAGVMVTILVCFTLLGTMMLSASMQNQLVSRNEGRIRGVALAEAGVEAAKLLLKSNWNATSGSGTLYTNPPTNTISAGTFSYTITVTGSNRLVRSTGVEPGGRSATVVAILEKEDNFISNYAQLAQGAININGTVDIDTNPLNTHDANVHSNTSVTMGSNSVVDGTILSVGAITGGSGYYPNQSGVEEVPFPDTDQINQWKTDWLVEANATNNTYTGSNIFSSRRSTVTITAPAFINGDVSIGSGQTLILQGPGTVWIEGTVRSTANGVLDNRALLAITGTYTQAGQSVYRTGSNGTNTATLVVFGGDLSIAGTAAAQGVVYCVSGNLTVTGTSGFNGALISGGTLTSTGTFNQVFPSDMNTPVSFQSPPHVEKVAEP